MKNLKMLFSGFFLTLSLASKGHTNHWSVGVIGGPSIFYVFSSANRIEGLKPRMGFSSGLFLQYQWIKGVSLCTNISFERKSYLFQIPSIDVPFLGPTPSYNVFTNTDNLTLPFLVRAARGKKIQYFMNAGTYFSYEIKTTIKDERKQNLYTVTTNPSKRFDKGLSLGLGVSVPIKSRWVVSGEARSNCGLGSIIMGTTMNYITIRTNTNVLLCVTYKLGKPS